MKRLHAIGLVGVALLIGGCGGESSTGPKLTEEVTLADLVGTWEAVRFVWIDVQTSEQGEAIALGWEVSLTITSAGAFSLSVKEPDEQTADTAVGTIVVDRGAFVMTEEGRPRTVDGDLRTHRQPPGAELRSNRVLRHGSQVDLGVPSGLGSGLWNTASGLEPTSVRRGLSRWCLVCRRAIHQATDRLSRGMPRPV